MQEQELIRRVIQNPQIAVNAVAACKAARPHFTNPKSLVGHQLQAAIDMADVDHIPRREGVSA
jgi:hypothetical protein